MNTLYHPLFKVYSNLGTYSFIDTSYDITFNTLTHEKTGISCSNYKEGYDNALLTRIASSIIREFNCSIPFIPRRFYPWILDPCGQDNIKEVIDRYNILLSNGQATVLNDPCTILDVFLGLPTIAEYLDRSGSPILDRARIRIYFKSMVRVKRLVYDYTSTALIADIGGYTGFLLGVSAVNISQLLNKFVFSMFSRYFNNHFSSDR